MTTSDHLRILLWPFLPEPCHPPNRNIIPQNTNIAQQPNNL
uniref:Uncharacterized protein n=1 Tax=Arundo donax TaxID=35708 RepID=A0A0A9GVN8_ARUDO